MKNLIEPKPTEPIEEYNCDKGMRYALRHLMDTADIKDWTVTPIKDDEGLIYAFEWNIKAITKTL